MQLGVRQQSKAVRNVVIGVFVLVFAAHVPEIYRYTQLRHDIEHRYRDAGWAKSAVENAAAANDMASLPRQTVVGADRIDISPETGVVTVAFGNLPPGRGETLKMLPIVLADGKRYPLETYLKSGNAAAKGTVFWACSSSLLRSLEAYIKDNSGTLASEIAPSECRYITWLSLQ